MTSCGTKHTCLEKAKGGRCIREEHQILKNAQVQEDIVRKAKQEVFLDMPFCDPSPVYLDLRQSLGGLRICAEKIYDIDMSPEVRNPGDDVLGYAQKVIKKKAISAFYVGVTDDPGRRLSQHSRKGLFTRMIVIARTTNPLVMKLVEKHIIEKLHPLLNRGAGGEGINPLSKAFYLYVGYGVNKTGHELRV